MAHSDSNDWQRRLETATKTATEDADAPREVVVPLLTVLAHSDPARVGEEAWLAELAEGRSVELSRLEPLFQQPTGGAARPLAEPRLSRTPLRLSPRHEGLVLDAAECRTKVDADGEALDGSRLLAPADLARGVVLLLGRRVTLLLTLATPVVRRPPAFGLVGESWALVRLRRDVESIADLHLPVLLRGESGTGKELVARAIQSRSPRRDGPFLSLNMGAIPPNLAASELFGAAKGAYSGADHARQGYFRRADGGTLFLDEIGETPPEVQALLLRALESGEVQPLGEETNYRVDVRVLAATDADLDGGVERGGFKAALLHRLRSYEIALPPLRDRREDLGRLFFHFLRRELETLGESGRLDTAGLGDSPFVPARLLAEMTFHDWPGNVRELRNAVRQMAVASRGRETLRAEAWEPWGRGGRGSDPSRRPEDGVVPWPEEDGDRLPAATDGGEHAEAPPPPRRRYRDPSDVGDEELLDALRDESWNLKATAERLGVSRGSLYVLVEERPGIRKASDLSRGEIEEAMERVGPSVDRLVAELEVSKQGLKRRMTELGL